MFGLLGKKLGHSFSKTIHENFTNEEYKLIETNNLNQFFNDYSFKGLNVTIPYKQDVIKHLDELSPEASEINSVNTVIFENGKLIGYNTDDFGLSKMLNYYNIDVSNKTIIILGNGSTSRTIQHYCSKNHAKKVVVLARNPMENEYYFKDVVNFREASIIFNATPVGMFPNNNQSIPISLNELPNLDSVVDMIYNPLRSLFILEAEEL
jgi:shikimate dehydrogenase